MVFVRRKCVNNEVYVVLRKRSATRNLTRKGALDLRIRFTGNLLLSFPRRFESYRQWRTTSRKFAYYWTPRPLVNYAARVLGWIFRRWSVILIQDPRWTKILITGNSSTRDLVASLSMHGLTAGTIPLCVLKRPWSMGPSNLLPIYHGSDPTKCGSTIIRNFFLTIFFIRKMLNSLISFTDLSLFFFHSILRQDNTIIWLLFSRR